MKRITSIILVAIVASALVFVGCKKDEKSGCTDKNADNYDPNAVTSNNTCKYRYLKSVYVSVSTEYDNTTAPDLHVRFAKASSSTWDYEGSTVWDYYSATWTWTSNVQFTNETWQYEILDDDLTNYESIATGSFNPLSSGSGGSIQLTGNYYTLKFNYEAR